MPKRTKKLSKTARPGLKIEALEQRQLLATGFTDAQGQQFSDIVHANGNVYDQVLLKTSAITVINDPGQITRVSFLDLEGDIVQAEFSGSGQLSISLSNFTGPAEATKYNQPGIKYVSGLASFTIQGSDATTNFSVFSVGTATAHNGAANPIFTGGLTGGDNTADVQRITIVADPSNPNGSTFGGIRAGNADFVGEAGVVGITAANVQVQDVVIVGDIDASKAAIPTLIFGTNSQFGAITVAGGDLAQTNTAAINNTGSYNFQVTLAAGTTSGGTTLPAAKPGTVDFTDEDPFGVVNNTFTLTTSVDTIPGLSGTAGTTTAGNDTVNATIGAGQNPTLTALDKIDTGAGTDTMELLDLVGGTGIPGGVNVSNLEVVNFRSVGAATADISAWTGVTNLNVTQAASVNLTVPSTTALTVAGVTGGVTTTGGSTVSVTSDQTTNAIVIDKGTDITVNANKRSTGTITIGGTTAPSGAVSITATGAAYEKTTADTTLGLIDVTGGTTVTVTQSATSSSSAAATDTANTTITQSQVNVTGTADTTAVTVVQDAAVTKVDAVTAVAGTKETVELTFSALTAGQTTVVDGLTFTASKALTAAQVAAAFANLSAGATHGPAAASSGIYSGTLEAGWTSGAASSTKVTFTGTAVGDQDLDVTAGAVDPTAVVTNGTAETKATTGKMGIVQGKVAIDGADKIATVSLTSFGAGSTIDSDALTSLSLAKSNEDVTITNAVATTLGLTLDGVGTSTDTGVVDAGAKYTTVNITANGTNSYVDLTGAGITTLTVGGSKVVDLDGSTLAALKTVTVSGSAGLVLDGDEADTITSIDASGTSGAVTATIDPTKASYSGSTGADTLTFVTGTTPSKTINLGAGDDTLSLAAGTTSSTSELVAGDGTDTLVMAAADAQTASATGAFETKITGFEKLSVGQVAATTTNTVNLDNMDEISYVISAGLNANDSALTLTNMANAGTLEITGAGGAGTGVSTVTMKDATGGSDSLNIITKNGNDTNFGEVVAADVESINLTATDTSTSTINTHTIELKANEATTVTITGNANVTLTLDATTDELTTVDGSAMTGKLTATGNGTVSQTTKGGSAADTLTAGFQSDTLIGNGGADSLVVNGKSLVTLTGGDGADKFNVSSATVNVNSYATITDLTAGDFIQFNDASDFLSAKISLDPSTAVFQDYANAAINSSDTGDVTWFQYNGNTYVIENRSNLASFVNGTDIIVKVSGLVDLSNSVLNSTTETLLIV